MYVAHLAPSLVQTEAIMAFVVMVFPAGNSKTDTSQNAKMNTLPLC